MNAVFQATTFLPACAPAEPRRRSRSARMWAALAVAALDWAALALAVLAFVAAGVTIWLA